MTLMTNKFHEFTAFEAKIYRYRGCFMVDPLFKSLNMWKALTIPTNRKYIRKITHSVCFFRVCFFFFICLRFTHMRNSVCVCVFALCFPRAHLLRRTGSIIICSVSVSAYVEFSFDGDEQLATTSTLWMCVQIIKKDYTIGVLLVLFYFRCLFSNGYKEFRIVQFEFIFNFQPKSGFFSMNNWILRTTKLALCHCGFCVYECIDNSTE